METNVLLDIIVGLTLLWALVAGASRGFGRTIGGLAGAVAGLAAAVVAAPWIAEWLADSAWRVPVIVGAAVVLVGVLAGVGATLGQHLRAGLIKMKLRWVDTIGGAVASVGVAVLAWMLVGSTVASVGNPTVTEAVQRSRAMHALAEATPTSLQDGVLLTRLLEGGEPWLAEVVGGPTTRPSIPDVDVDTAAVQESIGSVVKVSGTAQECQTGVSGSGVVVAPDRVITNAHVIAGIDDPTVRAPGELPVGGEVVYVDEHNDLAVIATSGLDAPALRISRSIEPDDGAVVAGYPRGGPLTLEPAEVVSERRTMVTTEGGAGNRSVLTLATQVDHGNSGGPVLDTRGDVAGIVFASSAAVEDVGYAVPISVVEPVAAQASSLTAPVPTGSCEAA